MSQPLGAPLPPSAVKDQKLKESTGNPNHRACAWCHERKKKCVPSLVAGTCSSCRKRGIKCCPRMDGRWRNKGGCKKRKVIRSMEDTLKALEMKFKVCYGENGVELKETAPKRRRIMWIVSASQVSLTSNVLTLESNFTLNCVGLQCQAMRQLFYILWVLRWLAESYC